jgi:transcriptional regulator with XRE-family HTH domain
MVQAMAEEPRPSGPGASGERADGGTEELEAALGTVIAQRVREYRLQVGLSVGQLAARSGLSKGMLSKMENAQASPSLATLARLSTALSVPITSFFRGLDEERDVFYVKAGQGMDIQHPGSRAGHRYQILGSMRGPSKRMEPVLVTLMERSEVFPAYQHPGTELIYMLAGRMEYGVGGSTYLLEPGDALQFNGEVTHGPTSLEALPIQFLTVKVYGAIQGP